jgi:catechol 2,3-dioxygenase-like lactoylglutathione lyase family enzyme
MEDAMNNGMHHIGIATHDMEATLDFFEQVVGFPTVVCEINEPPGGGAIRHAFVDTGRGDLIGVIEINGVAGISDDFDTSINGGLSSGPGVYHFAFRVDDRPALEQKQRDLEAKGVEVRGVVDHGWCASIYFRDPNGLQLEFCCTTAELGASHVTGRSGESWQRWKRS